MIRRLLLAATMAFAAPAPAQMHAMPGMAMPAARPAPALARRKATHPRAPRPTPHRAPHPAAAPGHAMEHDAMPGMTMRDDPAMPAMDHDAMPGMAMAAPAGTDQPAGDAPPPPAAATRAADRFYAPAAMAAADAAMRREHGGMRFHQILFNLAEVQVRRGGNGYRWDGAGWFGGDIDRLVVRSEGEGRFGDAPDTAEVQALWSRAVDPYWNVQAGLRQDFGRGARRTHLAIGVEGLAPYWFDVEGTLFVSDQGVRARAEAWIDQRLTQRAILQPRVELNLAAQDEPDARIGAGLSSAELGLRLRYEIAREFAPYVGVTWERRYAATARFARADGEGNGGVALGIGVRTWF